MPKYNLLNKMLPGLESEAKTVYNKKALEALRMQADEEARLAEQLAAFDNAGLSNTALKDQLAGLDVSKLPKTNETGFQLVGSPQEKGFVLGESGPISRVPALIPEKNLPVASKSGVPSVIDVEPINVSTLDENKLAEAVNPEAKKFWDMKMKLAAAGAGGAGLAAGLSGDNNAPAMAAAAPQIDKQQEAIAPSPEAPKEKDAVEEFYKAQLASNFIDKSKPFELDLGDDKIREAERLAQAQQARNDAVLVNQIGRSGDIIGAALAGGKPIAQEAFNANIAEADNTVKQLQARIQAEKDNPDSPKSRAYRQMMEKMGYKIKGTASASDLERIFPQITNLYQADEARKSKREMAQLALAQKAEDKKTKADAKKEEFTQSFRKELTTGPMKDLFNAYQKSDLAVKRIQNAMQDPSGYKDLGNLYGYLKSLDSDSAVREGELALGLKQGSIPERLKAKFKSYITGEMVSPEQRKQMEAVIVGYANQNREAYLNAIKPILEQAQRIGVDPREIDRTISETPYNLTPKKQKTVQGQAPSAPKAISPNTQQLIQSRSDDENRQRLLQLKQKYNR